MVRHAPPRRILTTLQYSAHPAASMLSIAIDIVDTSADQPNLFVVRTAAGKTLTSGTKRQPNVARESSSGPKDDFVYMEDLEVGVRGYVYHYSRNSNSKTGYLKRETGPAICEVANPADYDPLINYLGLCPLW